MTTPDMQALFAVAREDAPAERQREAVFAEIALATGLATAAATAGALSSAPSAAAGASSSASAAAHGLASAAAKTGGAAWLKSLVLVAALGTISTLLAVTVVIPESPRSPARAASEKAPATVRAGAKLAQPAGRKRDPGGGHARSGESSLPRPEAKSVVSKSATRSTRGPVGASDLAEEAQLVTAARHALLAGDAASALALMQSTHKWSARALEPEELGLEARALRALGRADEAAETELLLRRRYPDHALAR